MLVQCPQCSAAYDFPDDRVTAKGLRAACGRCKLVMLVKPAGADGKAVVEVPPAAASEATKRKRVKRPKRRAAPVAARRSKSVRPKRSDSIVSDTTRATTAVDDAEPSIVIDMTQFNDGEDEGEEASQPAAAVEPEVEIDEEAQRQAREVAAFSPFAVAPVQLTNPRYAPPMPASFDMDDDLPPIRQAAGLKMFFVLLLLSGLGFVVFVAWKNDWGPIWEDPKAAIEIALALDSASAAPATEAPAIVEKQSAGKLEVGQVRVEWIDDRAAMIHGVVDNKTDRIQGAIGLDVTLQQGSQLLGNRVVPCCAPLELEAARAIAKDAHHGHFDVSKRVGELRLQPGQSTRFSAILRGLPAKIEREKASARVAIKYAEPERVKP